MNLKRRRIGLWIGACVSPVAFALIGVEIYGLTPSAKSNCYASTTPSEGPSLPSRAYDMPPEQTLQVAAAVIARLPGWTVDKREPGIGVVTAKVRRGLGILKDDVSVQVLPQGRNALVIVRSASRIEDGVLGANADNIRALQSAMDERLPPAS